MNLFEFSRENYEVVFSPELLMIEVFKKIIDRDKTKDKSIAKKEMAFIYFFVDIRSDYMYITDKDVRKKEIRNDLHLPDKWVIDKDIQTALDLYEERSTTVNTSLYRSACIAAMEISEYLKTTKALLEERTDKGSAVTNINTITGALSKVPAIMRDLSMAQTEVIKEQKITEGRTKGSRNMNPFEDGFRKNNGV